MLKTKSLYWQLLRPIFVVFFIYLLGDAFFRWDGFRYYASFTEFLPSIALVTILWTIMAVFIAIMAWMPLKAVECFSLRMRYKFTREHLLLFVYNLILLSVIVWFGKALIWSGIRTTFQFKLLVLLCISFISIFLTNVFRNKAIQWQAVVNERLTPLVWLFGIFFTLSIPLVIYQTWIKENNRIASQTAFTYSSKDGTPSNIILITFDALTARDMSVYGYDRLTTPFIDEWAKTASVFTKAEAGSNFTTPTTASLMTGKRVWTHQAYHVLGTKPVKSKTENLPLVLKNNDYTTMAFVVNPVASVKALGVSDSFDKAPLATELSEPVSLFRRGEVVEFGIFDAFLYRLFGDKIRLHDWIIKGDFILRGFANIIPQNFSKTAAPPEKAFNKFLSVIDNRPLEPFFAWIHVLPPHGHYLPPKPYMGMFGSLSEPQERARYDEFIRYCDKKFEEFIAQLKIRNKLENTIIILSSDHGESFEHDYLGHGGIHLYEQVTHIPLIIKEPSQTTGQIIDSQIEQIDISATILDLAHIPVPLWMEGRSLVPLMRGQNLPSRPAFSMAFERNSSRGAQIIRGTIAVWDGDYKLVHYVEEKKSLLFDLASDPGETKNILYERPDISKKLIKLINDNLSHANMKIKQSTEK